MPRDFSGPHSYRYENIAATPPLASSIPDPKEGDRGRTATGCILVYRNGQWVYA